MPSKTNEDKIDELANLASGFQQQIRALDAQVSGLVAEKADLFKEVGASGKNLEVVKHQVLDLRIWKDSFGTIDQLKIQIALV